MDKEKNHITSSKDYQRYLSGLMSSSERHEFEKRLLGDDFEADALEGIEQLSPEEFEKDISVLSRQLKQKVQKSSFRFWRIAAAVVILTVSSFSVYYFMKTNGSPELAQSNEQVEDLGSTVMNEKKEVYKDSMKEEPERIIALQQEVIKKNEKIELEAADKREVQALQEIAMKEETKEMDMEHDVADELAEEYDAQIQEPLLDAVEPAELPSIASEQRTEINDVVLVEESLSGRVAGVASQAPQARNKKASFADNTKTIRGKVYSVEDETAVPGVNVVVKGASIGTITDIDGNYSINVPEGQDVTLVYSYIGLSTMEIQVDNLEHIDVKMEPDFSELAEVVVVAYGVAEESENNSYSYIPPKPDGSKGKWKDYIKENIRYPSSGMAEKIKGTVKLRFTVNRDGSITNMEVLKSLGDEFDKEAIRLVNEGPKWEPAKLNDEIVKREVRVKIRFRPPE